MGPAGFSVEALVLAGGRGARLHVFPEAEGERNKCMLRVGGIPLVEYSFVSALRAGARAIVVVVGRAGEEIVRHFGCAFGGIPIRYAVQPYPRGVVDAMEHGRRFLRDPEVLLCLGDEILDAPRHPSMLRRFRDERLFASCGVVRVDDRRAISKTYALIADGHLEHGRIRRLVEKPRVAQNDWMGTGNCLLRSGIFDYVPRTPVNPERGEKELPDLIQCAIDEGRRVEYFRIADSYVNVNTAEDALVARARCAQGAGV
jgi:dTDP-glucose pyrophosphorylase